MPKPRRVLEMGTGKNPRKIVALARKHPSHRFIGIDLENIDVNAELRRQKELKKPENLELHSRKSALHFLRESPTNHFRHIYSHFLLGNMSRNERLKIMASTLRVLEPGGRWTVLNFSEYTPQLQKELQQIGFETHVRYLTPNQLKKEVDSEDSQEHSRTMQETAEIIRTMNPKMQQVGQEVAQRLLRDVFRYYDGENPNIQTQRAINEILKRKDITDPRPFGIITAVKRVRR